MILLDSTHLLSVDMATLMIKLDCSGCGMSTGLDSERGRRVTLKVETKESKDLTVYCTSDGKEDVFTINSEVERGGVVKVSLYYISNCISIV